MVKTLPTVERSTKIRFGRHAREDQGENSIVLNASNTAVDAIRRWGCIHVHQFVLMIHITIKLKLY